MYDECPSPLASPLGRRFSGKIHTVLTINATSENQANRYMLQEKDLGLGNQDFCPWRECQTKKNYGVFEAIPNELGSSDFSRRQV
ncbi:hypothetical protein A4S05_17590 [Nostoc sp. KVJ20]|nr:hypothetical protein A4S05_17590 [Nostoc sp. KVJ20]